MIAIDGAALAIGFARSAAFAAAMPLGRAHSVPRVARVALALALTPLAAAAQGTDHRAAHDWGALETTSIVAALQGAGVGLCATVAAGAAAAAGGLIDNAMASQSLPSRDVFGDSGPVGLLCTSAFGWFFFGSALPHLAEICISAHYRVIGVSAVAALAGACAQTALAAASPALAAQAFATVVSAGIARMAPRVNGIFLGAPIASTLVLASLLAGGAALLTALAAMAWRAAVAPGVLLR